MIKKTHLSKFFPMIRTREEISAEIEGNPKLKEKFGEFSREEQKRFIDMCAGEKGVKILYDAFFKEIMNPDSAPGRMSSLLSVLLGREVKVVKTLPPEDRIADEKSLLVMDIVVQTEDGELINCEVQKIGYKFVGERASCYSADLLLRQYKRIRDEGEDKDKRKTFNYKDIKDVYTIVFLERSQGVFHEFRKRKQKLQEEAPLVHRFKQESDTGIELGLLQNFVFIPLDIFGEIYQNKPIDTNLAAWLMFLSTDEPERILELVEKHPEFQPLYEDLYNLCRNAERVMEMFSKELQELDRNTVDFMIDEYRQEIAQKDQMLEEKDQMLEEKDQMIGQKDEEINQLREMLKRYQGK